MEETGNRTADFQGHLAHGNLHSVILLLLPSVWEQSGISKPWHRLMRMNRLTQIPLSQWLDSTFTRQANQPKYCLFWMSKKISWLGAIVHLEGSPVRSWAVGMTIIAKICRVFILSLLYSLHINPLAWLPSLPPTSSSSSPFYKWENWSTERLHFLPVAHRADPGTKGPTTTTLAPVRVRKDCKESAFTLIRAGCTW